MEKRRMLIAMIISVIAGMLLSCSESNIGTEYNSDSLATGSVNAVAAKKTHGDSPQKVFSEFQEMVKKVETMSKEEINRMSDEEILELGKPILKATENTVELSKGALQKLNTPLGELFSESKTITKEEHKALSKEIDQIIASDANREIRSFGANDVRDLLLKFKGEETMLLSTCETMFTVQGQNVILMQGDNFNLANYYCPAGYQFTITSGTHTGQYVQPVKSGNTWVGAGTAIMDGQNNVSRAFTDLQNNTFQNFEIRNYSEYGIYSTSSSTEDINIHYMTFNEIGDGKNGEFYGAIRFDNAENIYITDSYFEDVSSSILFDHSDGPLKVLDNEALNPGRNFVQCGYCYGEDIRIKDNSIEHNSQYGSQELEDVISIYRSEGESYDPIQVDHNRVRTNGTGNGVSGFGSAVMLGDHGGKYQEATNNIGVNPGNVGAGSLGGEYMTVEDNKMYSDPIEDISNVAFSSYNFCQQEYGSGHTCGPCSNHEYSGNVAHWYCYRNRCGGKPTPILNKAHAPSSSGSSLYCGLTVSQIRANSRVLQDTNMDEDVWDEW